MSIDSLDLLDNVAWHSLAGPHAHLAEGADVGAGLARRYRPDVAGFHAVAEQRDPRAWADLAALAGPGAELSISGDDVPVPTGWVTVAGGVGVQLVETDRLRPEHDEEAVVLGPDDVPEMLAIVARNKPGPFRTATALMGSYLGIRREGRLVAMAGERLHPPGWTEISAVCTDVDHRGQGLASRLVRAVAATIHDRGDRALLHAAATNTSAISVYLGLGFELRRHTTFRALRTPEVTGATGRVLDAVE